jgi:hypothetical protein
LPSPLKLTQINLRNMQLLQHLQPLNPKPWENLNCSKIQKEMFERVNVVERDNEQRPFTQKLSWNTWGGLKLHLMTLSYIPNYQCSLQASMKV